MFGAGGEVSSLAEKKGECHQMQICPPPKKPLPEQCDPVLLEGSTAGAGGGTPLGSAGLMEQGRFDQGGGLMVP